MERERERNQEESRECVPKYTHQRSMGGGEVNGNNQEMYQPWRGMCGSRRNITEAYFYQAEENCVSLYAHTPVCRHILVPKIIQRKEHMSYTCWCLQFGSSTKHAKASGCACLVSITEECQGDGPRQPRGQRDTSSGRQVNQASQWMVQGMGEAITSVVSVSGLIG